MRLTTVLCDPFRVEFENASTAGGGASLAPGYYRVWPSARGNLCELAADSVLEPFRPEAWDLRSRGPAKRRPTHAVIQNRSEFSEQTRPGAIPGPCS